MTAVDGTVDIVIDVVVPVLDEAEAIPPVLGSVPAHFARIADQIDGTAESEDAA